MRLWHETLIPQLPRQQLLGQHRECCALRGKGWGKPHKTVDYVFQYGPVRLFYYHCKVMEEMKLRGYQVDERWRNALYRGKNCSKFDERDFYAGDHWFMTSEKQLIYPEHDRQYLYDCIDNLHYKGVYLNSNDVDMYSEIADRRESK